MTGRKGITLMSDIVLTVSLLFLIAVLWVYVSSAFQFQRPIEGQTASAVRELYASMTSVLANPGSCSYTYLRVPKGVRVYLFNLDTIHGKSALLLVRPAGEELDLESLRNSLVKRGIPRSAVKFVYINSTLEGVGVLINRTFLLGAPDIPGSIVGVRVESGATVNWSDPTLLFLNYKNSRVQLCSTWDNTQHLNAIRVGG